jgi:hypothetical protein
MDASALNAGPPELYRTERWGDCVYTFPMKPLAGGAGYTVRLHFAETTFDAPGRRAFNVLINGQPALSDFDVFQTAGGKDKAVVKEFSGIRPDGDGNLQIKFQHGSADQPEINALEIAPDAHAR